MERANKEVSQAIEEERSLAAQMKELMERGQNKLKSMRRQVEEAVSYPEPNSTIAPSTQAS